jgi:hypothetical protein
MNANDRAGKRTRLNRQVTAERPDTPLDTARPKAEDLKFIERV